MWTMTLRRFVTSPISVAKSLEARRYAQPSNYIINIERIPCYQLIAAQHGIFHLGSFPESSDHNVWRSLIRVNRKDCWKPIRRLSLFFVLKQRRAEVTL